MRPVEALLVVANLLTWIGLAAPRLHFAHWMRGVALVALALAIVQVVVEGPRWQIVPAYLLTGLFLCAWLAQSVPPVGGVVRQIAADRTVASVGVILCAVGVGISAALPIVLPVFQFPRPGGPYAVGTVTYHWADASRREVFSPQQAGQRELMVQIWYPARKGSSAPRAAYIADADAVTTALARLHRFPDFSFQSLRYVTTNAAEAVPVADDQLEYPVLIFLEGLTGYRQMNTFQVEELASHGYIVVAIDQPGVAASVVFPDGHQVAITGLLPQLRALIDQSVSPAEQAPQLNGQVFQDGIIPYFAQDVSFTLDQLAALKAADPKGILSGKLDLQHTGVFGISLGGMIGAEACLQDPRLKACLVMDVDMTADVVQKGLQQPSMWITRPADTMRLERQRAGGWAEKEIQQAQATMRAVYNGLPGDGYFVQVPGIFHIDFTDLNYLSPIFPIIGFSGPIGPQRGHDITNAYSVAFFDKHLKGEPEALLDRPTAIYPEVIFSSRAIGHYLLP